MAEFNSGWAYIHFSESVRGKFRFAHSEQVREFLRTLVDTCAERTRRIPADSRLWRAQLGFDLDERTIDDGPDNQIVVEEEVPFRPDRMKPRRNAAHEGRANPKGIPCLYVATDQDTAMAEVRPWIGARMSLGQFRTNRELSVVDFSIGHDQKLDPDLLFGSPSAEEIIAGVLAHVDRAFSEPVNDDPSTAEYVPTQIIAKVFRRAGYDGLVYKSLLGKGFNFALFDLNCVELKSCCLFKADKLEFSFSEVN